MRQGQTILVAAVTATVVTSAILSLAVPRLVDRAARKMLQVSAAVMAEGFTSLAQHIEASQVNGAGVTSKPNGVSTTWPVPNAALHYVN